VGKEMVLGQVRPSRSLSLFFVFFLKATIALQVLFNPVGSDTRQVPLPLGWLAGQASR
jgi:hypothetical protein